MAKNRVRRIYEGKKRDATRVIRSYQSNLIRVYCTVRFQIINMRILDELDQYVIKEGKVLDLGCGFGLFSLYFALREPGRRMISLDLNPRRIVLAKQSAVRLGLKDRTNFINMNVLDYPFDDSIDSIFMLDLLHHLPKGAAEGVLRKCVKMLKDDGIMLVKDVDSRPLWKAGFTWLLDKAMDYRTPVNYIHHTDMLEMLEQLGLDVKMHTMVDILPYPHVLYVCRKLRTATPS